ncbi:MORN repeat protein, putative [Plasmodium vivax]|nr:MORN repeat protein, putative [Plasmodium vivax]
MEEGESQKKEPPPPSGEEEKEPFDGAANGSDADETNKGLHVYPNKSTYEGFYLHGKKSGVGKLTKRNGAFYEGNFQNGQKHGAGFQRYSSGDFYYGEWRHNKKDGRGIYFFASTAEYYFGEWCKGSLISGAWVISGEAKYVGTFFRNLPKFKGEFLFANDSKMSVFYEQTLGVSSASDGGAERVALHWRSL